MSIHVTVWGEFRHEKKNPKVAALYPDAMHETIAAFLRRDAGLAVTTAWLDQPEHGLTVERLEKTDVLLWWGHMAHGEVADEVVERVHRRVLEGLGLVVLHSGHYSKIFKRLMGTTCSLKSRESTDKERVWNVAPHHPITAAGRIFRDSRRGNVWRAVRNSGSGRIDLHFMVHRRRSLPQRGDVAARERSGLLLPTRARNISDFP